MKKSKMQTSTTSKYTSDVPMSTSSKMSNYEMETKMDSEMDKMDSEMDEMEDGRDCK